MRDLVRRLGDWLYDWRQTLRVLRDQRLARELRAPAEAPMADEELT